MQVSTRLLPAALGSLLLTTTAAADSLDVGLGYFHNSPSISQPAFGPMPQDVMALGPDAIPGLSFKYFPTPAFSIQTFVSPTFKFALKGDGAMAAAGKLGSVKVLQPTVLAHWHPLQSRYRFDPFIGGGLTYVDLKHPKFNATGIALLGSSDALKVDDALAPIVHAGTAVQLPGDLRLSLAVAYLWTKSDVELTAGPDTFQTKADMHAWIVGVVLHKRFRIGRD